MPASGLSIAATTGPQDEKPIQQMFEDYVRARTYQNWKFWIVSFQRLFFTFIHKKQVMDYINSNRFNFFPCTEDLL